MVLVGQVSHSLLELVTSLLQGTEKSLFVKGFNYFLFLFVDFLFQGTVYYAGQLAK